MKEPFDPSRREFTLASALALLSGVTITVARQSSDTTGHHHLVTFQGPMPAPGGGYY